MTKKSTLKLLSNLNTSELYGSVPALLIVLRGKESCVTSDVKIWQGHCKLQVRDALGAGLVSEQVVAFVFTGRLLLHDL